GALPADLPAPRCPDAPAGPGHLPRGANRRARAAYPQARPRFRARYHPGVPGALDASVPFLLSSLYGGPTSRDQLLGDRFRRARRRPRRPDPGSPGHETGGTALHSAWILVTTPTPFRGGD